MGNMEANPKNIGKIFLDNPQFKIPVFQRDYSWKMSNWKELWEDILGGYKEDCSHYLGSVVLVDNGTYKEVVDGQQRLTTLSIILKAIHWNFNELIRNEIDIDGNKERVSLISQLLFQKDIYDLSKVCNKIRLNDNNDNVYSSYIIKDKDLAINSIEPKSNELLIDCYKFYKNAIRQECTETSERLPNIKLLLDYYKYITERIIVVEIIVSDYSNAYIIFETLNDRGLELTVTDLLKNYLFSKEVSENHSSTNIIWNKIISSVGEKNLTKYIRHYWNCNHKKVTEKELFKVLKKHIDGGVSVKEFLTELQETAVIYNSISNPNSQIWGSDVELIKYLEEIKLYNVDLCYPVILATQLYISDIKLKRKIFKLCARVSFRYITICNGSPGDLENAYNRLCLQIFDKKNSLNFEEEKTKMKEFIISKEEFIASFSNKVLKTRGNKKLILEILKAIEKNLGGDLIEDKTIEHILPESPDNNWKEYFDGDCDSYKYRIGNYTLLEKGPNSEIGNEIFDKKIEIYANSSFEMTKNIHKNKKWNVEEIECRQKKMAIIVENIWSM